MNQKHDIILDTLNSHLSQREQLDPDQIKSVICPYPLRIAGENFYKSRIQASLSAFSYLQFSVGVSSDIKLYCLEKPGIYTVKPGKAVFDKEDFISLNAAEALRIYMKANSPVSGITGAISLPFVDNAEYSGFQIRFSVLMALKAVNQENIRETSPDNFPGFINELSETDAENSLTVMKSGPDAILNIYDRKYEVLPAGSKRPVESMRLIIVNLNNGENCQNYSYIADKYEKILSILKIMAGIKNCEGLEDIPQEGIERYLSRLPSELRSDAYHHYRRIHLLTRARKSWMEGDIPGFGKLVSESSKSFCEMNSLNSLVPLIKKIDSLEGVYGTVLEYKDSSIRLVIIAEKDHCSGIISHLNNEFTTYEVFPGDFHITRISEPAVIN